jgi:hypothetical protein
MSRIKYLECCPLKPKTTKKHEINNFEIFFTNNNVFGYKGPALSSPFLTLFRAENVVLKLISTYFCPETAVLYISIKSLKNLV